MHSIIHINFIGNYTGETFKMNNHYPNILEFTGKTPSAETINTEKNGRYLLGY